MGLWNFRYPIKRLNYGFAQATATCGRGEIVVRVRERLKTEMTFFFGKCIFGKLISLSQILF